jgi:hypothetical protein
MAYPEIDDSNAPDDKLAGLVQAIAAELMHLGYCTAEKPGHLLTPAKDLRVVDEAIWKAMKELQSGRKP